VQGQDVQSALAAWREAERRMDASEPGSPESRVAMRDAMTARARYRALTDGARFGEDVAGQRLVPQHAHHRER
jgi:hypothetical protein